MAQIKVKISKDKVEFSKGKGKLTTPIEPPHRVCEVCNDDGGCLNNINHPDYEKNNEDDSFYGGTDLYDCSDYSDVLDGRPKGMWMVDWYKKIKKNEGKKKPQGGFKEWNQSLKK